MSVSPFTQGGGFPLLTGFGPTSMLGGFSNTSFGTPGITGFGFPTPFVDPTFFFTPAASSFFINKLLGFANGTAVPINIGPIPSTLGLPPYVLGFPYFGGGSGGAGTGQFGGGTASQFGGFGGGFGSQFGGFGGGTASQFGGFGGGFGGFGSGGGFNTSGFGFF